MATTRIQASLQMLLPGVDAAAQEAEHSPAMIDYTFERMADAERRRVAEGMPYQAFGPFGVVTRSDLVAMSEAKLIHPARTTFIAHVVLMGGRHSHQEPADTGARWVGVSKSRHRALLAMVINSGLLERSRGGRGRPSIIRRPQARMLFPESVDRARVSHSKPIDRARVSHPLRGKRHLQQHDGGPSNDRYASEVECIEHDCTNTVRIGPGGEPDMRCLDCHQQRKREAALKAYRTDAIERARARGDSDAQRHAQRPRQHPLPDVRHRALGLPRPVSPLLRRTGAP